MKILHVITSLRNAAGTSVFAGELASRQAADGHTVSILVKSFCEAAYPVAENIRVWDSDEKDLFVRLAPFDIVHIHALWDPWLTRVARRVRKAGAKVVWSPHGMLTPWALKNKWPKKLAGLLAYQYWSLRAADLIHVTAETEAEDVRRLRLKNRIVLAPLGVHLPEAVLPADEASPYVVFVSRIQRKKGLPNLLKAWARVPAELKRGWQIKIAGPDQDNHLSELYALCDEEGLSYAPVRPTSKLSGQPEKSQIVFLGPVFDAAKDELYARAAFSVLPTHSENFGSVVIESLAQGTPVICTKGAPWRDLADWDCGWWIDIGVDPLVTALTDALRLFDGSRANNPSSRGSRLAAMGENGRRLVKAKFAWPAVARTVEAAYRSLI